MTTTHSLYDWTLPLVVAVNDEPTDREVEVRGKPNSAGDRMCFADWHNDGHYYGLYVQLSGCVPDVRGLRIVNRDPAPVVSDATKRMAKILGAEFQERRVWEPMPADLDAAMRQAAIDEPIDAVVAEDPCAVTRRDRFAMAAMGAVYAAKPNATEWAELAEECWHYADAMERARKESGK